MKKYYIEYRNNRDKQRKFITEKEYNNIEIARKNKEESIFIPSLSKTEFLKDFQNDILFEKNYSEEKQELDDFEIEQIKRDKDLNENFNQIKKTLEEKYKKNITRGILWGLKNNIIYFKNENINFAINGNKFQEYWKISAIDDLYCKKNYAENKYYEKLISQYNLN